jgi:hypothetical protein
MSMDKSGRHPRSHLFTVRVWQEEIGQDQTEWRGKVQLISNGNVCYFRGWEGLVPLLLSMLSEVCELVRKHDYRFSDVPRGNEMTSWRRATQLCAGNRGVR